MWGQPPNPFGLPPMDPTLGVPPLRLPTIPVAPMAAAVQAKPQSHAFLREGGPGRTIIGIIADALAGATGGQGTYGLLMAQKRKEQMDEERQAREDARKANQPLRTQVGEDLIQYDPVSKQTSVLYHGQPRVADEFSRYLEQAGIPAEQRPAYYRKQVENMVAPKTDWQAVTDPTTGVKSLVAVPRVASNSGETATTKEQYDALPPGASYIAPDGTRRVKGGPTPQASGTFR